MGKNKFGTWFLYNLTLFLLVFFSGKLAMMWSLPPLNSSPIWPPIGITVAFILLFGRDKFYGALLGAIAIALSGDNSNVGVPLLILSSVGSTTFALVAAKTIINRFEYPRREFLIERDILLYLVITGPLLGLFTSSWGIACYAISGTLGTENLFLNWMTWFIGDSIGGIVFSPLALIFSKGARAYWMRSFKNIVVPLLFFFFLILGALHYVNSIEREKVLEEFGRRSQLSLKLLEQGLQFHQMTITTLKSFIENSEIITPGEFQDFTGRLYNGYPEIQFVAFLKVSPQGSISIEHAFSNDKNSNTQILRSLPLKEALHSLRKYQSDEDAFNDEFSYGPVEIAVSGRGLQDYLLSGRPAKDGFILEVLNLNVLNSSFSHFFDDERYGYKLEDITNTQHPTTIFESLDQDDYSDNTVFFKKTSTFKIAHRTLKATISQANTLSADASKGIAVLLLASLVLTYLTSALLLIFATRFVSVNKLVLQNTLHLQELNSKLIRASQAKSEFLANMSHEIRTPLHILLGSLKVLDSDNLNEEDARFLGLAEKAGDNLLNTLNEILDLSKIESGQIEIENIEVNIQDIAREVFELFQLQAQEKAIELSYEVSPQVAKIYSGDPTRIKQVLSNLVSNAIKFTSHGRVDIKIERNQDPLRPGNIYFAIQDSGVGISEENIPHLFQPFSQADSSISRRFGGTGLGLSICKMLAELMGGDIRVQSSEGQGSTFSFTLPLLYKGDSPTVHKKLESNSREEYQKNMRPLHILIADDSEDNRNLIKAYLKGVEHRIYEVQNGQEAVDFVKSTPVDLIIMDMQMPVLDGLKATEAIRNWESEQSEKHHVQIWAITAFALESEIRQTREAGCDKHLAKPVSRAELYKSLFQLQSDTENK